MVKKSEKTVNKEANTAKKEQSKTVIKTNTDVTKKAIQKEEKRLITFLKNKAIDNDKFNIALALVKDIAFMTVKTDELKKDIETYGMVETYQNGANQSGRKKSASFEAYLNMTKQKSALIKQLTDLLPTDENYIPATPEDKKDDFDNFLKERKKKHESDNRV